MRSIFEAIPEPVRRAKLQEYAAFLADRDGEPNYVNRTLSRREIAMTDLESSCPRFQGHFDANLFAAQYAHYNPARPTSLEMLTLLVLVKSNANEAYAVDKVRDRVVREDPIERALERWVLLEEEYHTRMLAGSSQIFGVRVGHRTLPVPSVRAIVAGISRLPETLSRPITLAGEVVAVLTFLRLIGAVRKVFARQPIVRDALEHRLTEIIIDEVGHMSLNRLFARPGTFALARTFLPVTAMGTRGALPEAEALGVLPLPLDEVGRFDSAQLPQEIRQRSFIV